MFVLDVTKILESLSFLLNIRKRTWFNITKCYQLRPSSWPASLHCMFCTRSPLSRVIVFEWNKNCIGGSTGRLKWFDMSSTISIRRLQNAEYRSHDSDCKGSSTSTCHLTLSWETTLYVCQVCDKLIRDMYKISITEKSRWLLSFCDYVDTIEKIKIS